MSRFFAIVAFTTALIFSLIPGSTRAAGGITVAPAYLETMLTAKEPAQDLSIGIRNDFSAPIILNVAQKGVNQQQTNLVPGGSIEPALNEAISIVPEDLQIGPGKSINVLVQIKDVPSLAPGGHYASILIKQVPLPGKSLTLQPAVSVALYIIKEGGATRILSVSGLSMHRSLFSLPSAAIVEFKNSGNVHVVPRGTVELIAGKSIYSKGLINDKSIPVFPGASTKLQTKLVSFKRVWLPKKYSLLIEYRYDESAETKSLITSFWYIPPAFPFFVVVLALASFYLISRIRKKRYSKMIEKLIVQPFSRNNLARFKKKIEVFDANDALRWVVAVRRPTKITVIDPKPSPKLGSSDQLKLKAEPGGDMPNTSKKTKKSKSKSSKKRTKNTK